MSVYVRSIFKWRAQLAECGGETFRAAVIGRGFAGGFLGGTPDG